MATARKAAAKAAETETEDFAEGGDVQVIPMVNKGRTDAGRTAAERQQPENRGKGNKIKYMPDDADGTYLVGTVYIPVATVDKYGEPEMEIHVRFPE